MAEIPKYDNYSLTELYQALDLVRPDLYPEIFAALEQELESRQPESKTELVECYLSLDKDKWPQYAAQLREQINALGRLRGTSTKVITTPLPVKQIFLEGIRLPFKHLVIICTFGSPLIVLLIAEFSMAIWSSTGKVAELSATQVWMSVVLTLGFIPAAILATVACHRIFILGEKSMFDQSIVWWSSREWRFIGWGLLIGLLGGLFALPIMVFLLPLIMSYVAGMDWTNWTLNAGSDQLVVPNVVLFLIGLPIVYLISRWSLVFPATATDQRPSLSWAWTVSTGNGLRVLVLIGLLPVVADFVFGLLPQFDSLVYSVLVTVVWLYVAAVEIALLSLSYKALIESEAPRSLSASH
jgi:hypothetical protein